MIIVKIKGGLGNQMFQHAIGKRLSLDWGQELKYDLSWFKNIKEGETARKIGINNFNITISEATEVEINKNIPNIFIKFFNKIKIRLNKNIFFEFNPRLIEKKRKIFLNGYFQSFKYFDSIRKELLNDFILKNGQSELAQKQKEDIINSDNSVGLHIRRGDFVTNYKDYHGLCSLSYYAEAVSIIKQKYHKIKLFVFSDDIEWAKENIKFADPMVFVSGQGFSDAEEILLMSLCKHQIIANSTFSWWAAWLNKNNDKIVVSPKKWLVVVDIDTSDLLPKEWIKI